MIYRIALYLGVLSSFGATFTFLWDPQSLVGLFELAPEHAVSFLVRRYAASATAALGVMSYALARSYGPQRAGLMALASWYIVMSGVAAWGIAVDQAAGAVWLALAFDPIFAVVYVVLAIRIDERRPRAG